ncbi:hypothetical protein QJQ45_024640 [Haematococcus lacustris]|nr:hypothetical protein QJQ45_024640 [Haematococcus lacustris]
MSAMQLTVSEALSYIQANPAPVALAVLLAVLPLLLKLFTATREAPKPFLDPAEYKPLQLGAKEFINHNTLRLRFDLPNPKQRLGLPIGQHIAFKAPGEDGKDVFRSYTPISDDDKLGSVTFVIKIYPFGKMSQILNKLEVGQSMLMRGPKGSLTYKPNMKQHIGMLAGGTGITPMYQVLNAILKNPADKTQVSLLFGNITADDILMRDELEQLARSHPSRFKMYHVLNVAPDSWTQGVGFITPELIKEHMPPPGPDTLVLRCGPGPMNDAMKKHLGALGYDEGSQFQF